MIVDAHVHIFEAGMGGPLNLPSSAEDLVRAMDGSDIDMAVVLPLPGVAGNHFVQQQCAKFPDRLVALYTPDFADGEWTVNEMNAFFEEYCPRGLKIHPRLQQVTIDHPKVKEALAWASDRDLPVVFDAFPYGDDLCNPAIHPAAYTATANAPGSPRMILAHAGGYKVLEAFLAAKACRNIYLDVSFTPVYFRGASVADDLAFVCSRLPVGRVLYGSDFPYVPVGEHREAVRQLLHALPKDASDSLWGGAAASLFRL